MKRQWIKAFVAVCMSVGLWAGLAMGSSPVPNVMGGATSAAFSEQTGMPTPETVSALPIQVAPGMFVGDYLAAGIKGVGLRVKASGTTPSYCVLFFYSAANNREWTIPIKDISTTWSTFTVPFDYSAGWMMWDSGGSAEKFEADLRSVSRIGIRALRAGTVAQSCDVSDFMLLGGSSFAAGESLYNFMVSAGISDVNGDSDNDGLSDWGEFLAGTNPKDAASAFVVNIRLEGTPTGAVLKWNHIPNRKFAVWRASNPGEKFTRITPVGSEIVSDANGNVAPVAGDGPYFYKVEILE